MKKPKPKNPKDAFVLLVEEQMRRQDLNRQRLSARAHLSQSTVEHFFIGKSTLVTRQKIADVLGITGEIIENPTGMSRPNVGGYKRSDFQGYETTWRLIRPTFYATAEICVFDMEMIWTGHQLILRGMDEAGNMQQTSLMRPGHWPFHYFSYGEEGFAGLMVMSSVFWDGHLYGAILTAGAVDDGEFKPVTVPCVLSQVAIPQLQRPRLCEPDDAQYAEFKRLLDRAASKHVVFKPFVSPN